MSPKVVSVHKARLVPFINTACTACKCVPNRTRRIYHGPPRRVRSLSVWCLRSKHTPASGISRRGQGAPALHAEEKPAHACMNAPRIAVDLITEGRSISLSCFLVSWVVYTTTKAKRSVAIVYATDDITIVEVHTCIIALHQPHVLYQVQYMTPPRRYKTIARAEEVIVPMVSVDGLPTIKR